MDGHAIIEHPGLAARLGVHDDPNHQRIPGPHWTNVYCRKPASCVAAAAFARLQPYQVSRTKAFRTYEDRKVVFGLFRA